MRSTTTADHSDKSILTRSCDPRASASFAEIVPPLIGNATYISATNDRDFIHLLKSRKWTIVFFAPGACRISAARRQIPGGNFDTKNWTVAQYKELVKHIQGEQIEIVETMHEAETIDLLNEALSRATITQSN